MVQKKEDKLLQIRLDGGDAKRQESGTIRTIKQVWQPPAPSGHSCYTPPCLLTLSPTQHVSASDSSAFFWQHSMWA